ncbi:unnamed protein product [Urochloa decumbens]|uniref:Uncharacterized protein n=1 Tax=Urochloa decumbens TaxID=240449 RepID=A0ABC8YAW9_9POAL
MQPVSSLAPARVVVVGATTCQARATASATTSRRAWPFRRVAPAPQSLRARATGCGGGRTTEPVVEAREDVVEVEPAVVDEAADEAGLAAEELEVLEEAAIAGVDEGRRPMDYDRRAHILEESSRVFRDLKHRHDGDGETGAGHGGAPDAATEAGTGTRQQQQQQLG